MDTHNALDQLAEPLFADAFCSYCGHPPESDWRERPYRVCRRCKLGMVLGAPARTAPHRRDPFLIVDHRMTIQGISRVGEELLSLDEPVAIDRPLDELLLADERHRSGPTLERLIRLAL